MARNFLFSFHNWAFLGSQVYRRTHDLIWVPWLLFLIGHHEHTPSQTQELLEDTQHKGYCQLLLLNSLSSHSTLKGFLVLWRWTITIFLFLGLASNLPISLWLLLASNFLPLLHHLSPLSGSYPTHTQGSSTLSCTFQKKWHGRRCWHICYNPSPSLYSVLTFLRKRTHVFPNELALCGLIQSKDPTQPWSGTVSILICLFGYRNWEADRAGKY